MKRLFAVLLLISFMLFVSGCDESADREDQKKQELLQSESTRQLGLPAITHFREKRLLKMIYELRDQEGLTTYTYVFNQLNGRLVFLGESIGYGIPYAAQYSNPQKISFGHTLSQAEPNGLFTPSTAEGTWVLLKNPNGKDVQPVYVEPRIVVSPFRLPNAEYPK